MAAAERGMRPGLIDAADRRAIESAHDDLLAAEEAARKRFASPGARRRREEARDAEQRVLGRFGFTTYEDYVLANAVASVDTTAKSRLAEATEIDRKRVLACLLEPYRQEDRDDTLDR